MYINILNIHMFQKNCKIIFLIFKMLYIYLQLFYFVEGKRIKFTDVTVEVEDTKKRFGQDYETVHSTGATMTIVIRFV